MIGLLVGLTYPVRALALISSTPRLWRFVLIPIAINLLIGATLYAGLLLGGLRLIDSVVAGLPGWAAPLAVLLQVLLVIALLLATGFVLVRFGVVLGSPWYSQLSEQIEALRIGQLPTAGPTTLASILGDIGRSLLYELKKLLLVVAVIVPLLLIGLIPAVGQVLALAGEIALGATIACLDFLDGPLERRRLSFRAKLGQIWRSLPASAGFGLVCLGLVSIPLVNLLAIPICVAAGTLFDCDYVLPQLRGPGVGGQGSGVGGQG